MTGIPEHPRPYHVQHSLTLSWCRAMVLALLLGFTPPAVAQAQDGPVPAPPQMAVQQNALAQGALRGGRIEGVISIPNRPGGALIQPEGQGWRIFRHRVLIWVGAAAVPGTILALALFHLLKGRTRIKAGRSGRGMIRFGVLERANHWMAAFSFIVLGLSGFVTTYGHSLLRPLTGAEGFITLIAWAQAVHQYFSFPFVLGLILMLALWAGRNLFSKADLAWLRAGGPTARGHPPAGKFNAGQKLLFWFVIGCGAVLAASGYLLMFPSTLPDVTGQQWAHVVHGILAMLMIAVILGHIYAGSIGTEGSFEAMGTGRVDYNWAKEHHSLWLDEELAKAHRIIEPPHRTRAADMD